MPLIVIKCPKCQNVIVLEDLADEDILVEELTDTEEWDTESDHSEEEEIKSPPGPTRSQTIYKRK